MKNIKDLAIEIQNDLIKHRRHLHANPEIGLNLPKTQKYIIDELKKMGYNPEPCGGYGVVALVGGFNPGKVFLIRGDMDALPIKEETNVDFKSKNNFMHACGHDLHTSMMLGAAKILKDKEKEIKGTIKLMFQPGEETFEGAKAMIEDGILQNPKVDAALMFHVTAGLPIPSGKIIGINSEQASFSSDWFEIKIQGKGGHGASPETTIDPLNIASHIHIALQAINSRELSSSTHAAITIGSMFGGETSNVIPDKAELHGTIRVLNEENRSFIQKRIKEISSGIASTFRGKATTKIIPGTPSVKNNINILNISKEVTKELLNDELIEIKDPIPGSEDFGYLSQEIPTLMLLLTAGNSEEGYKYGGHHPKVEFDDSVLYRGAAMYAGIAIKWLETNS